MLKQTLTLALCLTLYGVGIASAETALLDEIVVRGERQLPNEETLTIREVRESPARDLGEALQNLPGLTSVRKGAIANDIVLRGLQRDNLNMLLDGVRLHGGCPSRMDPPSFHFDFAEVESVEVIKGPYDLRNPGSLGGMINAVSKSPAPGPFANLNLSYGSFNFLDASATAGYGGDELHGLLGYARKSSDVPESGDGKRLTEIYPATSPNRYLPGAVDSSAYETDTFWAKGGYQTGRAATELAYSYQNAEHVLYPYLLMDADYDRTHRVNLTSTLPKPFGKLNELQLQLWYNQVEHLMNDTLRASSIMGSRAYMMQTDSKTSTVGAKLNVALPLGSGKLSSGLDFYRRNWDAVNVSSMWTMATPYTPQPMIPDVDIDNFGLFAEYRQPLSATLQIKGGARFDYTRAEANSLSAARLASLYQPYFPGSALDNTADFSEPSANLQLTWQLSKQLELFTGIASASRTPDQQELFIGLQRLSGKNWLGNPGLKATRNNQLDLGAKWSGPKFFASASLFYSKLADYIDVVEIADPDGAGPLIQARSYRNIDATLYGAEFGGQLALPYELFLKTSLSYVHGDKDASNTPLAEMPPLAGSVSLRYDNGRWFVEASERFAASQNRVDLSLQEEATSAWGVTDLKGGINWEKWALLGGVNNIFDRYYYTHLSYQRDPFASGVRVPETGLFAYLNLAYHY